jgi:hypothetical protein
MTCTFNHLLRAVHGDERPSIPQQRPPCDVVGRRAIRTVPADAVTGVR